MSGKNARHPEPTKVFHAGPNAFYNEDCVSGSRVHLNPDSVDLIVTDPPYGIEGHTLHKHYKRREAYVVDGYVEVPVADYSKFSLDWIRAAERVLRPGGQIYIVSGYTNLYHVLHALRQTSLREVNHLIWKYNFGVFTRNKFVSSHYHILLYEKPGGPRTFNTESRFGLNQRNADESNRNYLDREDVWIINREYKPGQIKNKNELPQELLTRMIQYSSNPGDLVCDFFLGGFSTARVAIGLNRKATGFEISAAPFENKFHEVQEITPGALLETVPKPRDFELKNQGKAWTPTEERQLFKRYKQLRLEGSSKKACIALLTHEFQRGRFAILNALEERAPETRQPARSNPRSSLSPPR